MHLDEVLHNALFEKCIVKGYKYAYKLLTCLNKMNIEII